MNHREFSEAAESLRADGVPLAEWLDVDSSTIEQWASGERRIPRIRARQLTWLLRQNENDQRLKAADLPTCAWSTEAVANLERQLAELPTTAAQDAVNQFSSDVTNHTSQCEACRTAERWKKEHLKNNGPFPLPGFGARVFGVLGVVPQPLVPAAIGAALLGGVVAVRFVFAALALLIRFPGVDEAIAILSAGALAIIAAAIAGGAGGLVIPVVRPVFRRLGAFGDYLTAIAVVETYMFALVLVAPVAFGETLLENPGDWKLIVGLAAFFGLVGAFAYRRNERTDQVDSGHAIDTTTMGI